MVNSQKKITEILNDAADKINLLRKKELKKKKNTEKIEKENVSKPKKQNKFMKTLNKAREAGKKQFTYTRNSKTEEGKKEKCIYKLNEKGIPKLYKVKAMD